MLGIPQINMISDDTELDQAARVVGCWLSGLAGKSPSHSQTCGGIVPLVIITFFAWVQEIDKISGLRRWFGMMDGDLMSEKVKTSKCLYGNEGFYVKSSSCFSEIVYVTQGRPDPRLIDRAFFTRSIY